MTCKGGGLLLGCSVTWECVLGCPWDDKRWNLPLDIILISLGCLFWKMSVHWYILQASEKASKPKQSVVYTSEHPSLTHIRAWRLQEKPWLGFYAGLIQAPPFATLARQTETVLPQLQIQLGWAASFSVGQSVPYFNLNTEIPVYKSSFPVPDAKWLRKTQFPHRLLLHFISSVISTSEMHSNAKNT